ncbi:MAG: hypothetical protein HY678_03810 [Chloroflexi bacterium]|nr:hypothetical protein [Chloroflexota bacterium]
MSDALLTVFSFAIVLTSITTLLGASLNAGGKSNEAWVAEASAAYVESLGSISPLTAMVAVSAGTTIVDVVIENAGARSYSQWKEWDVAVQYTTASGGISIQRLSYTSGTLSAGKWTVSGIYLNATTRITKGTDPDVLNPVEQMVLRLQVSPVAGTGTTGMVVITTVDGLSTRILFDA